MLREYNYIFRQLNIATDLCLALAAFFIAHFVRSIFAATILEGVIKPVPLTEYTYDWKRLLLFISVLTVAVQHFNGFYSSQRLRSKIGDLIRRVFVSCVEITALLMISMYIFYTGNILSRSLVALIMGTLFVLLALKTYLVRRFLMRVRSEGYNFRRLVLVGSGEALRRFIRQVEEHPIWGLRIEGIISDRPGQYVPDDPHRKIEGYPLIGDLSNAAEALTRHQVDEVVLLPEAATLKQIVPLMSDCEVMGLRTHLPLVHFDAQIARPSLDYFDDLPSLSYSPVRQIGPALFFKYTFDRVFGAILLILSFPLFLLTMIAIRLTSKRGEPIFFGQTRCGLNGRRFTCWKFRTMTVDAERRREELEAKNEVDGPVFKMRRDPRVTPLGRWLRKFSIDEMPQLWNVVRGDMSLVGPRPPLPQEVNRYDRWQRRRLSMKPGITCLWQVSGRHRVNFETWMKLDLQYIDNWSLTLDFKILMRTILVVITGQGAM